MKRRVLMEIRSVYGVPKAYPTNSDAKAFAQLARRITLDKSDLELIATLGFKVEYEGATSDVAKFFNGGK